MTISLTKDEVFPTLEPAQEVFENFLVVKDSLDSAFGVKDEDPTVPNIDDVMNKLSPKEQAALNADPSMLNDIVGGE